MSERADNLLHGGRIDAAPDALLRDFSESISFDARLWRHDIAGSRAHVRMLVRQGLLTDDEGDTLLRGLDEVAAEFARGDLRPDPALEDVHMHVEARLTQKVGDVGGKLHTARSRNDQVATDLRLYCKDAVADILAAIDDLRRVLVDAAERYVDVLVPGYTHLQRAQPVRFGHHLLAYHVMLVRDRGRFAEARARLDVSPLGCGALATTSLPIDRAQTARDLGFAAIARNSLDAVSDRDFAMELCAAASITMVHLSRLSEDLVLWASEEFGFVALPDAFCTTSSLMPQKKNPDVPELVRGKTGRVAGDLVALLTVMKGLPLSYNRDMQEDKEPLFDALDTVLACLRIYTRLIPGIEVRADRCAAAAARGFMGATDLADHLVCRGVPFRQAHGIVGRIVARALAEGRTQGDLTLAELRAHSPLFDVAALEALRPDGAVEGRDHPGGPARARVIEAIAAARAELPPR